MGDLPVGRTLLIELGVPAVLIDALMGHSDGSVQAIYSHVTAIMIQQLLDSLTRVWEDVLEARRRMSPRSAVAVLDRLLGDVTP